MEVDEPTFKKLDEWYATLCLAKRLKTLQRLSSIYISPEAMEYIKTWEEPEDNSIKCHA